MEALQRVPRYTYAEYAEWELDEGERFELMDGIAYAMAAPSVAHQRAVTNLLLGIGNFLKGRRCQVFAAPFDVCLNAKGDNDDTVVQPDLVVICDKSKLDEKRCNGAPDLVVEIVSPSSQKHDRFKKFHKYQNAGVREYWMVDITDNVVDVAVLEGDKYLLAEYSADSVINSAVLEGFSVVASEIFAE
ncbi:MAG: Uma2 family endonuclease [Oscillospiraceae bacterium]|nr:Uma2 family endonuclease [Oscillospiraceae bacterium]